MTPADRSDSDLPAQVRALLDGDPRTARCPPDRAYAVGIVDRVLADECEDTLHAAAQGRWAKANTYSYDGARKSVEAWLLAHGWRIRPVAGAHAAVTDIVAAWLRAADDPGPRIARAFGAARKARHEDEYPSPTGMPRTDRELRALVLDNVRLINLVRTALGLAPSEDVLPTESRVASRPERQ